ncbi:MAG: NAD-dependent epimerase/dehydratase family protein, partial [Planctomycetes bacterium]|nr:NAD-dependent epimerase/dehydratase family protein [Planctomycetota bacterium]
MGSWNCTIDAPLGLLARKVALAQGDARRATVGRNEINRKMTMPYLAHNDRIRSTRVFPQQFVSVGAVRITSLLLAAVSSGAVWSAALAQDAVVGPAPAVATAAVDPAASTAPAGDPLRAVFIDVAGKVQWRANENSPWQDAKVNDVVAEGVEVRTGLRSHAAMRIGRNATALIDAGTLFQLPNVVQEGDTLRTAAAVKHGRADFKVDKVGLSNDFKVVTPSTTLAVRGTEFAVATGPLKQVEVLGARRNAINAIELKYSLNNTTVQMSRDAASSSNLQNPAHAAVVAASAPASGTGLPVTTQGEAVQNAANGAAPSQPGSSAQATTANRTTARAAKAAGRAGVQRVVFPSSLTVYGASLHDREVVNEASTPPVPEGLYGITKYAAERLVLRMASLLKFEAVAGRIGAVFGPWETFTGVRGAMSHIVETLNPGLRAGKMDIYRRRLQLAQGPRIVALGGGTGLSTILRGLKHHTSNITAIVTVTDDGGSSGQLIRDKGIIPPGDLRNCLVALADAEKSMTDLFQHRFKEDSGTLSGHAIGNLLITALADQAKGDFEKAVELASTVLNIRGQVLPATLDH